MRKNSKYYLAGSIALITFLLYITVLRNGFVWDDLLYVSGNPHIRSFSVTLFKWAFFDFYAANWHPLTWISHAIDYALWGLNPLGHHLTNIILHAMNTFLVVLLAVRLLDAYGERREASGQPPFFDGRATLIAAGVTGLLFGLHPVHVESVAWVAERKDLLCALFFLLSVMAYIRHAAGSAVETRNRTGLSHGFTKHYLAALGFFVLALLSKPMAVSLPAVLLILDWHPFNRIRSLKTLRAALLEKSPFIALSLFSSIITVFAQKAGGALQSWEFAPLSTRLIVGSQSLIVYLGKMLWPLDLVPYYPYPKNASLLSFEYGSAIACAIGITIACAVTFRKQKIWLSAWGYYFITLLPVLGIVQVGGQSMADRYTYLPSFGPSFVIGVAVARAWVWMPGAGKMRPALQLFSVVLVFFLLGSLAYLSLRQIEIWKDSVSLWSYIIEKEPDRVPVAYNNRGLALKEAGRFDEAIADFEKTIALDPSRNKAYNNLGVIYLNAGLFDKSIECFNKSIAINPTDVESYNNRGAFYAYTGQYEKALEDFSKAIELRKDDAAAYYNRGSLYRRAGREELAVPDYQKACALGIGKACAAVR